MLLDHIASGYLEAGGAVWIVMRTLGRLSEPIMCYFIAEGFFHTSNLRRYALRLLIFAIISHVPFTLYFGTDPLFETGVMWGLFMGLLALAAWQHLKLAIPWKLIAMFLCALLAFPADWGYISVFWILAFGMFRPYRSVQMCVFAILGMIFYLAPVAGAILSNWTALADYGYRMGFVLAIPLLTAYHGSLGRRSPILKWGFYAFYPLHLLVLYLLRFI